MTWQEFFAALNETCGDSPAGVDGFFDAGLDALYELVDPGAVVPTHHEEEE